MDAKPQRPVRALRVIHDENAPLDNPLPAKSIHQRNKSTPALSSLLQNGAQRVVGTKRAAFADLSNTTRPAQDDSVVGDKGTKATFTEFQKPLLTKPAQRPLAVKSASQITTTNSTKAVASSIPAPQGLPTITRKVAPKRSASILKDITQTTQGEQVEDGPVEHVKVHADVTEATSDHLPLQQLDVITEESAAPGPVQPVKAPTVSSSVEDGYILALEHQAQTLETERNVAIESEVRVPIYEPEPEPEYEEEDELEFEPDEYTRNMTGGATATTIVLAPRYTSRVRDELEEAKMLVEGSRTEEDIEEEMWDTSMVAEYGDEIFEYMRSLEDRMRPNAHYMDFQQDIQWSMRAVLVDWVVQVHHRFQLLPETLFLAVNYIDRFLSVKVVSMGKLQLVGATALFLAAKYEEVNCPSIQEIVYMVDNGYSQDEILKAERFMLSMLAFELGWPGPMSFLRRISKADDYDLETRTLAKYFLEITICDERFLDCTPSFTAAGAHCLARLMLRKGTWTPSHVYYSNYTYSQIRYLLSTMLDCCEDPEKHHNAVYQKYTDRRFKRASLFVQTEMKKGFKLPSSPKNAD